MTSKRLVFLSVLILVASLIILCAGSLAYYVIGPTVDNHLHIATARDMKLLRGYPVTGERLDTVLESRVGVCQWQAEHDYYIFATNISCTDRNGVEYEWELSHYSPRPWLPASQLYVTPMNRAATSVLPELLPTGVVLSHLPMSRYASGVVYDVARIDLRGRGSVCR